MLTKKHSMPNLVRRDPRNQTNRTAGSIPSLHANVFAHRCLPLRLLRRYVYRQRMPDPKGIYGYETRNN